MYLAFCVLQCRDELHGGDEDEFLGEWEVEPDRVHEVLDVDGDVDEDVEDFDGGYVHWDYWGWRVSGGVGVDVERNEIGYLDMNVRNEQSSPLPWR